MVFSKSFEGHGLQKFFTNVTLVGPMFANKLLESSCSLIPQVIAHKLFPINI